MTTSGADPSPGTGTYAERPSSLPGSVLWTSTDGGGTVRVLPDACMDLIWSDDGLLVTGPDTHAHLFVATPGRRLTGLRFAPGLAPRVLGLPASALTDQRVPHDAVWSGATARRIADRLAASADPGRTLEQLALELLADTDRDDRLADEVVTMARRGAPVAVMAERVGVSRRQLQRRCHDAFGYGAKTLTRVLRFVDAVETARSGTSLADTAARSGYADQAHLAREVRSLAGVPMGQLTR